MITIRLYIVTISPRTAYKFYNKLVMLGIGHYLNHRMVTLWITDWFSTITNIDWFVNIYRLVTLSHSSRISCIEMSFSSHSFISVSNGLINGDPLMVCAFTMWSSSNIWMSSTLDKILTPWNNNLDNRYPSNSQYKMMVNRSVLLCTLKSMYFY